MNTYKLFGVLSCSLLLSFASMNANAFFGMFGGDSAKDSNKSMDKKYDRNNSDMNKTCGCHKNHDKNKECSCGCHKSNKAEMVKKIKCNKNTTAIKIENMTCRNCAKGASKQLMESLGDKVESAFIDFKNQILVIQLNAEHNINELHDQIESELKKHGIAVGSEHTLPKDYCNSLSVAVDSDCSFSELFCPNKDESESESVAMIVGITIPDISLPLK